MRKVIGIGETILDIIFKNEQPTAAVPGGSTFNGLISLGRMGLPVTMITETGNDRVGKTIKKFMEENGVDNTHVCMYEDGRTAVSLAYLNERNDAEYTFYKRRPRALEKQLQGIVPLWCFHTTLHLGQHTQQTSEPLSLENALRREIPRCLCLWNTGHRRRKHCGTKHRSGRVFRLEQH